MNITTYAELQTYVAELLARDTDTNFLTSVVDFISMAESDLNFHLRARDMIATVNINPSAVNKYVALPTGFLEMISFNDSDGEPLIQVGMSELEDARYATSGAQHTYYAITSRIEFDDTGDASENLPMTYYKELDIETDLTNAILTRYPNLYVYGACIHAAPWLHDDARIQTWGQYVKTTVNAINTRDSKNDVLMRTEFQSGGRFNILRTP